MAAILTAAVPTGGAAFGAGVLTCRIAGPVAVGQAVTCVGGAAHVGTTGGTVFGDAVLRRTVLGILVGRGVAAVLVGALATIRAGIGSSVLRSTVISPRSISSFAAFRLSSLSKIVPTNFILNLYFFVFLLI